MCDIDCDNCAEMWSDMQIFMRNDGYPNDTVCGRLPESIERMNE